MKIIGLKWVGISAVVSLLAPTGCSGKEVSADPMHEGEGSGGDNAGSTGSTSTGEMGVSGHSAGGAGSPRVTGGTGGTADGVCGFPANYSNDCDAGSGFDPVLCRCVPDPIVVVPHKDGSADAPDGCAPPFILRYTAPGCGQDARPTCGPADDDACAHPLCGCDGQTIFGCGFVDKPFAHSGACEAFPDGGPDVLAFPDVLESPDVVAFPDVLASPDPDGSTIVQSDSGWQWNVTCPMSVGAFCADGAARGAPCIQTWAQASKPATWCSLSGVDSVTLHGYCNGYWLVSMGGFDYFYDITTGDLVHIDSNAIPSFTKCVAGASGSRFEVFGCNYGEVSCQ